MDERDKKHIRFVLTALLFAVQFAMMLYWGSQKNGFYWDEFFTFENAHYASGSTPEWQDFYEVNQEAYNQWMDIAEVKAPFAVTREESLLNDSLGYNIRKFLIYKPYMVMLNWVEALFFEGQINVWSGISINIVCFMILQFFLYRLVKEMTGKDHAAWLCVACYGFCGMAATMTVFVRFYMWVSMLAVIYVYCHWRMWLKADWKKSILYEAAAGLAIYLAFLNSPLVIFMAAGMAAAYAVLLLIRKRYREFACYITLYGGAFVGYIALKTDFIKAILNPRKYTQTQSMAMNYVMEGITEITVPEMKERVAYFGNVINDFFFSHVGVLVFYAVLLAGIFVYWCIRRAKADDGRTGERKGKRTEETLFYWALFFVVIVSFVCFVLFDMNQTRYYSSIFPVFSAVFIMGLIRLGAAVGKEKFVTAYVGIAVLLTAVFTAVIPRVEHLFQEDREMRVAMEQYTGIDTVVVEYLRDDSVVREFAVFSNEGARVLFTKAETADFASYPNTILIWQGRHSAPDAEALAEAGYTDIQQLALTHFSAVYLCSR